MGTGKFSTQKSCQVTAGPECVTLTALDPMGQKGGTAKTHKLEQEEEIDLGMLFHVGKFSSREYLDFVHFFRLSSLGITCNDRTDGGSRSVATAADMYVCSPRSKWQGEKPATVGHFHRARSKNTQHSILRDSEYVFTNF